MAKKKKCMQPDEHYGLNSRKLMAERRGELHLGQGLDEHEEYIVSDAPVVEMKGQQSGKNPNKGDSKG